MRPVTCFITQCFIIVSCLYNFCVSITRTGLELTQLIQFLLFKSFTPSYGMNSFFFKSDIFYLLLRVSVAPVEAQWHTHIHSYSVGLLWTRDRLVADTSTEQHTTSTTEGHPCLQRNSNRKSPQESGSRPTQNRPRGNWDRLALVANVLKLWTASTSYDTY